MEGAIGRKLTKKLVIEVGMIDGQMNVMNDDEMSYIEVLGVLEYAKMMFIKDWMEDDS